ncbi:MAG: ABC transporter substrate-binding protein, partial [Desulfobacterales bacterium]|nr:ABC transporter substrate-binding protein [Desulfobacterales bacterium]
LYIAFACALTGPDNQYGHEMLNAVNMRLARVNATGGVNGKTVKLLAFDDENDAKKAAEAARRIADNNDILLVIGHMYSSASIAGGRVYKERRIPAITCVATAESVTRGNPWYFRIIFDNDQQGKMLAAYASQVLGKSIASVIHDENAFGAGLAESFERASHLFGLTVNYKWSYDRNKDNLDGRLTDIVNELSSAPDLGGVFLAVHSPEGAALIMKMREKGVNPPLFGADSLAKRTFAMAFKDFPLEKRNPGVCANDLYVASYYIADTANAAGRKVREDYIARYGSDPNDSTMTTYDAVSMGLKAIDESGVTGENPPGDREKIRRWLAGVNSMNNAFNGVSGYIYFDDQGDAQKTVPIALFKNNRLISAPVQLNPVKNVEEFGKGKSVRVVNGSVGQRITSNDEILLLEGMHLQRTDYVYTGIKVNEIHSLDLDSQLFDMDFYLWFRFQEGAEPWDIVFLNNVAPVKLEKPVAEKKIGTIVYRKYHVKGRFKPDFLSRPPLFGQHILGVGFRHRNLTSDSLIYIVDELGIGAEGFDYSKKATARFLNPATGWSVADITFFQDTQEINSMGDPVHLSELDGKVDHSRFNLGITVKKITFSARGLIKSVPINYALLLASVASILLMRLLGSLKDYRHWAKAVIIVHIISGAISLLSGEALLMDALTGTIGNYGLEKLRTMFDILWCMAPAWLLCRAFRRLIIRPLEERTGRKVSTLLTFFVEFVIYLMAFFGVVAFVFDQKLTSLLGASGVLAMIIGLAIQINITNIFSGIAINLERPFRVGDWVKIGSDTGRVTDITWRTTRVHTIMDNIISVPNSIASEAVVVNYNYPDDKFWHGFTV